MKWLRIYVRYCSNIFIHKNNDLFSDNSKKKLFKNANKLTKRFFFDKNLFKIYQIETLKSDSYPDKDPH